MTVRVMVVEDGVGANFVICGVHKQAWSNQDPELMVSGPADCIAGETEIFVPSLGRGVRVSDLYLVGKQCDVMTMAGPAVAEAPFIKGIAPLFRVKCASGASFVATDKHRVMTSRGWVYVSDLSVGELLPTSVAAPWGSNLGFSLSESLRDGQHSLEKASSFQSHCSDYFHRCDGRPHQPPDNGPVFSPLQACVLGRNRAGPSWDVQERELGSLHPCRFACRHASLDCLPPFACDLGGRYRNGPENLLHGDGSSRHGVQSLNMKLRRKPNGLRPQSWHSMLFLENRSRECRVVSSDTGPVVCLFQAGRRLCGCSSFPEISGLFPQSVPGLGVCIPFPPSLKHNYDYTVQWTTVSSVEFERKDTYYDLHVPGRGHYLADGFWHKNTGKTISILHKIHAIAYKYPGANILLMRKKQSDVYPTVLQTFKDKVLCGDPDVRAFGGGEKPSCYIYDNGSRIWLGGLYGSKQSEISTKILSAEYDMIYVNQAEELSLAEWESLMTRCTGRAGHMPYAQMIGDCNPSHPNHWILRRRREDKLTMIEATHQDNPDLFDQDTHEITEEGVKRLGRLKALSGARLSRLYWGLWVAPEGAIYSLFEGIDPEGTYGRHVVKSFDPPPLWPRVVGIDPKGAYIAALWLAFDPRNNKLNVYREYLEEFGVTTSQHVENILQLTGYDRFGKPIRSNPPPEAISAWVGGAGSERQERVDFSGYGIPLLEPPGVGVWPGIDRINELLKGYNLVIHDCCANTLSEFGSYRRKMADGMPVHEIEDKNDFHCLVGSTWVEVLGGRKQLQDIRVGDLVLTRSGYKAVMGAACTGRDEPVKKVVLDNGMSFIGTDLHPVWVKGKGWVDLGQLKPGDVLLSVREVMSKLCIGRRQPGDTVVERGDAILILGRLTTDVISRPPLITGVCTFTGLFGKNIMVQFREVCSFITEMATLAITRLETSLLSRQRSIQRSIGQRKRQQRLGSTQTELDRSLLPGIVPLRVGHGIKNMLKRCGNVSNRLREYAFSVERYLRLGCQGKMFVFVPIGASPLGEGRPALMMRRESVSGVDCRSFATGIPRPVSAPVRVLNVRDWGREPVYNLDVDGVHEFFANGVLVHNCLDALRYAVAFLVTPPEGGRKRIVYNPVIVR